MYNHFYQNEQKRKKASPFTPEGAFKQRPFTMQLKTLLQQPDLKTSFSRAERYGHHLDTIQCAGLSNAAPIQMSVDEDEKLTSGINLDISKLNNKPVLNQVLSIASLKKSHKNHHNKNLAENTKEKEEKEKKQNSDEHLKSHPTNKATEDNSQNKDPEVTRLLNKQTQNNLVSQEKITAPPPTYEDKKSTPTPRVGTLGQYLNKREAMNIIGDNKEFAATQRAVKKVSVKDTTKSDSKAEDSKQQVKLKNAAELVRNQVINEDRQVKEHIQAKLNLDPSIIAKQGGEQLILQKMQ